MSYLQKLLIRGIRSFDDKNNEVIQFDKPITVICGHNGSGKTTIIECLKYASTGILPPNTKGGAFVHDPKMANEQDVKAQVKMRFTSTTKQTLTVTRNLQVSQKKGGGLTMKTLEGLLQVIDPNNGKQKAISSRCSSIDSDLPLFIGASKAVLDNVIFCHQEDSNWPLSEPAILKRKFDDIFEATRFTKALDNIKSLRKERGNDLKVQTEKLKSLTTDKDRSKKLKDQLNSLNNDIERKGLQYEELGIEIDTLSHANHELYESASKLTEIFTKVETLEQRESLIDDNIKSLKVSMTILDNSDQELKVRQENFQSHLDEQVRLKDEELRMYNVELDEAQMINRRLQSYLTNRGQLEAQVSKYENDLRNRKDLIQRISNDLNIRLDVNDDDEVYQNEDFAQSFLDKLKSRAKKSLSVIENIRSDGTNKQRDFDLEIQRLASELAAKRQAKVSIRQQIDDLNSHKRKLLSQIEELCSSYSNIEGMKSDVQQAQDRVDTLKHEINQKRYDDEISDLRSQIRSLEEKKDNRNRDMTQLNLQSDTRALLGIKRGDRDKKLSSIESNMNSKKFLLDTYLDGNTDLETIESSTGRVYREQESHLEKELSQFKKLNKSLNQLETMLNSEKTRLKGKKVEIHHIEKRINEAINNSQTDAVSLEEAIQVAEEEFNDRQVEINEAQGAKHFFNQALEISKTKKRCRCCNRGIEEGNEMKQFEQFVMSRLDRLNPSNLKDVENDMKEWQNLLNSLRMLLPLQSNYQRMKNVELPSLNDSTDELDSKFKDVQKQVNESDKKIEDFRRSIEDLNNLKSLANEMARNLREVKDLEREINSLERDLKISSNSILTLEEIQNELNDITSNIRRLNDVLNVLQTEKEQKSKSLATEQECYHEKQLELEQSRNSARQLESSKQALGDMEDNIRTLQERSRSLDPEIETINEPKDALEEEKATHAVEIQHSENMARSKLNEIESCIHEMITINKLIHGYLNSDGLNKLAECVEKIAILENQENESREKANKLNENIKQYEKTVASAKESERNLSDNIRYRSLLTELESVRDEIASYDLEETSKAKKQFDEMYDQSRNKEAEKQAQHHALGGELLSERKHIESLQSDLESEYKNIDELHHKQHVTVTASQLANDDLEKYAKALENAILQFHGLKMDEINDQIHHLWQRTYQGTDIDTIAIRSDAEGARGGKSYNYRVVMVKDRAEMDMRGRCSAGQKVLASIIIRLALADSFSDKCGILALDEPTTNLDQENIISLASGLAELINERRTLDVNFQIILITHDEEFISYLSHYQVTNFYWRVSRDEYQKSIIQRQAITSA